MVEPAGSLDDCWLPDRPRLRRLARELAARRRGGKPLERLEADYQTQLQRARQRVIERQAHWPRLDYDLELPVNQRRADILAALRDHQVVILCGETGSGKTTQLPKLLLELGRGAHGLIGHTQPRRLAARAVAARLAQELHTELGELVGYQVRFNDKVSERSLIKVMTDGILLAEIQGDPSLSRYDSIIVDEAHERSLNIDFLLGFLRQLLPQRPELKVVITSATIDADKFSRHFHQAPVLEVSGRLYPVELRYRPIEATGEDEREASLHSAIVDAVDELARHGPGDVLVFLPGEREIREAAEALRKHHPPHTEILPLFARLSHEDQARIFKPHGGRRVVLATNVAETSLTVPGIRYVIDSGLARINRYSPRAKVEQLRIEPIAQASANQRAGRCGRVAAGVCIRLYAEDDFRSRPGFTDPEIIRSNLAAVMLRLLAARLGRMEDFPFIDPPSSRLLADARQLLEELQALNSQGALTPIGQQLARLPLDPRLGRMLLAAQEQGCVSDVLIIVSGLALQDPRERPSAARELADRAHAPFNDERSDFLGLLHLWHWYDAALKHKKSTRQLIEQCHAQFLSWLRLREWRELHGQLAQALRDLGLTLPEAPGGPGPGLSPKQQAAAELQRYQHIHSALLTGLLGNVGMKNPEDDSYLGARSLQFAIHPGSALKKARPKWIVAGELTETTRLYGRLVARIEPEWLEPLAGELCQRQTFDPHWDKARGEVMAYERVTLYGLPLVTRRKLRLAGVDPKLSQEVFIRAALVQFELDDRAPFMQHNQRLLREVQNLEDMTRRQDVLVDEDVLVAWFRARLPGDVLSAVTLATWRKTAEAQNPKILFWAREDLMKASAGQVTEEQFPKRWALEEGTLPLRYRFDPGHPLDGVTATVPLDQLNQLEPEPFEWLVPGLLRDKVTHLFKNLPKQWRRLAVPVPDTVTAFLEFSADRQLGLATALSTFFKDWTGESIPRDTWALDELPPHLRMNFQVVDSGGQELQMGRDLRALQEKLGQAAQLTFREQQPSIERDHLQSWDLGDLPEEIQFVRRKQKLTGYPALVHDAGQVGLRLFDTRDQAQQAHRAGVRQLLVLELKEQVRQLEKTLRQESHLALQLRPLGTQDALLADWLLAITDRAFIGDDELPRSDQAYQAQKQRARTRLPAVTQGMLAHLKQLAQEYHACVQALAKPPAGTQRLLPELQHQLRELVYPGFVAATPWSAWPHLPRYLKGIQQRLQKYPANPARDQRHAPAVQELTARYQQRVTANLAQHRHEAWLSEWRWQLEELRISLFAQELRTPAPVSVKRLEKFWADHALS